MGVVRLATVPRGPSSSLGVPGPRASLPLHRPSRRIFAVNGKPGQLAVCRAAGSKSGGEESASGDGEEFQPGEFPSKTPLVLRYMTRTRKLGLMLIAGAAEFYVTGGLVWSPLASALTFILATPSEKSVAKYEAELVARSEAKALRQAARTQMVLPPETAGWINVMLDQYWQSFITPTALKTLLPTVQTAIATASPSGWTINLQDFEMGSEPPTLEQTTVYRVVTPHGKPEGKLALDVAVVFSSASLLVRLDGKSPVGDFSAAVTGVTMRAVVRLMPQPETRLLVWTMTTPPDISMSLQVKGPLIGRQDVGRFGILKDVLRTALKASLVSPNCEAVSLEVDALDDVAVDGEVTLSGLEVNGLRAVIKGKPTRRRQGTASAAAAAAAAAAPLTTVSQGSAQDGVRLMTAEVAGEAAGKKTLADSVKDRLTAAKTDLETRKPERGERALRLRVRNIGTQFTRVTAARPEQSKERTVWGGDKLRIPLGGPNGKLRLEVEDARVKGKVVAYANLAVGYLQDGSTGLWSLGVDGMPITARWASNRPHQVRLPAFDAKTGEPNGTISARLDMAPWAIKQPEAPPSYRSEGVRTVVLHIVEARNLRIADLTGSSDPYVRVTYDKSVFQTLVVYKTLAPVYNKVIVFEENSSLLARKFKIEVFDRDRATGDDTLGSATINLDLLREETVLDRWLPLTGADDGEVRVRMAVVPGTLSTAAVQSAVTGFRSWAPSFSSEVVQVSVLGTEGMFEKKKKRPTVLLTASFGKSRQESQRLASAPALGVDAPETFFFRKDGRASNIEIEITTSAGSMKRFATVNVNRAPAGGDWKGTLPLEANRAGSGVGDAKLQVLVRRLPAATEIEMRDGPPKSRGEEGVLDTIVFPRGEDKRSISDANPMDDGFELEKSARSEETRDRWLDDVKRRVLEWLE